MAEKRTLHFPSHPNFFFFFRSHWSPFFYLVAVHHVNSFVFQRVDPEVSMNCFMIVLYSLSARLISFAKGRLLAIACISTYPAGSSKYVTTCSNTQRYSTLKRLLTIEKVILRITCTGHISSNVPLVMQSFLFS